MCDRFAGWPALLMSLQNTVKESLKTGAILLQYPSKTPVYLLLTWER